ncbi:hypothetical protein [Pseudidiomarina woesei]|uniref:Uncharacterized protein n=1 Tax=Pseudidiomarina woesei TaxID=1381080 RepID=A0A0K6H3V5_9GAMM|nr:hypothetical protein [Pseudidiomarina woesei]CUA85668.1 Protein of unknown function (DUF3121) [Pseudidiomarina woesei]
MKQFMVLAGVVAALTWSFSTQAQDLSSELAACASIKNPLERLVCFDDIAAGKSATSVGANPDAAKGAAKAAGKGLGNARAVGKKEAESEFGSEHLARNSEGDDGDEDKIYITIVSHSENGLGKIRFETSNGQVWQQVSAERFAIDTSGKYYLERGLMSSYYLGREGQNRRTQVKRIK